VSKQEIDWEAYAKEQGFESAAHLAGDVVAWIGKIEEIVKAGVSGSFSCRTCPGDAEWTRDGQLWSVECNLCEWSATGQIPISEIRKN
jgi:hypothetical protein